MEIYSYHYGTAAGRGIGIRAQSRELENLPLGSFLKNLSSFRALESSEHRGEKLCYVLEKDGYTVFGLSYPESPKDSGAAYTAPCGLQYVIQTDVWNTYVVYAGEIVRTAAFRKPEVPFPEPATVFPQDKNRPASGVRPDVMARIVDGLAKAALSQENDVLLIGLPRGLDSEYETARSAIGEALDYLPIALRKNIRFLTGLPVQEGETKGLAGYENAIRLNTNVVFCPHQYLNGLKAYRSFIGVDMEQPDGEAGAFAKYILQFSNPETRKQELQKITARLLKVSGKQPYEELNQAAEDRAREKADEEAEALRRKAQAQANSKKKGGMRQDAGSVVPDIRKYPRSSCRTDSPGEKNVIENARKERGSRTSGTGHSGDDSGRPASAGGSYPSGMKTTRQTQNKNGPDYYGNNSREEQEEEGNVFFKVIIPIIAILFIVIIAILVFTNLDPFIYHEEISSINKTPAQSAEAGTQANINPNKKDKTETTAETAPQTAIIHTEDNNDEMIIEQDAEAANKKVEPASTISPIIKPAEESNTSAQETTPESKPSPGSEHYHRYAKAVGRNVAFRKTPSNEIFENIIERIPANAYVWAVCAENEEWTKVYYKNKYGYMMSKYLEILSPEESRTYDQAQKTPVPANMYGQ